MLTAPQTLPSWQRVLAVVAHPDDESFGLGALIDAFARAGAAVDVLCLTRGEASTLGAAPDLATVRAAELEAAGRALGARSTRLLDLPDGGLGDLDPEQVAALVREAADDTRPEGLLVFDSTGISGHPDHVAATGAALVTAERLDLPVLAWTLPEDLARQLVAETGVPFVGRSVGHFVVEVDRAAQHEAIAQHASQAVPGSVLWRRLELQGSTETLCWLRGPGAAAGPAG
ncbi:PIG-L deacetylase family protein [Ornithinimicrobium avium]|uniref:PIG-L family deacetylase n=1 Tax=Ornithinimicrobium avium TaxID=2283195 RepID=A0A345NNW7_9MICO|nr:PIG-L deacetylase family protein [Ornithinimicrobium avium]AXH96725.1 PIG-L family deacetylase [Ornithinimicrobium avium]